MNEKIIIKKFHDLQKELHAKNHLMGVLEFDAETIAPSGSTQARSITTELLSTEIYKLNNCAKTNKLIDTLNAIKDNLDDKTNRELEIFNRDLLLFKKIPMKEYIEYNILLNEGRDAWLKAKKSNDFTLFKNHLEKIINFNIDIAKYIDPEKDAYDTLLNLYEHGTSKEYYDPFFKKLKNELSPVILEKTKESKKYSKTLENVYPIEDQRKLSLSLMDMIGIDRKYCSIAETEHPFSNSFSKYDVRITTNYNINRFDSSMYSVLHEGGHALYELNISDDLQYTNLATGTSLGLHESQSRFYENLIGRSFEFINLVEPTLKSLFKKQLSDINTDMLYELINESKPSLIRIEADELTYSMHVLIRYEIEKLLVGKQISIDEAPKYWNDMYKKYLGVDVKDFSQGILQDIHWALGSIGYFPTYALGSAYASQIYNTMNKEFSVTSAISDNKIYKITEWLKDNIHKYGKMYDPKDIIEKACKEKFNPDYYINYLKNKFAK